MLLFIVYLSAFSHMAVVAQLVKARRVLMLKGHFFLLVFEPWRNEQPSISFSTLN